MRRKALKTRAPNSFIQRLTTHLLEIFFHMKNNQLIILYMYSYVLEGIENSRTLSRISFCLLPHYAPGL